MLKIIFALSLLLAPFPVESWVNPIDGKPGVAVGAKTKVAPKPGGSKTVKIPNTNWTTRKPVVKKPLFSEWSLTNNPYDRPIKPKPRKPKKKVVRTPPTAGQITTAVKQLIFPGFAVETQPTQETLIYFDTILFTKPENYSRSINLLGYQINLLAQPIRFNWVHGDGTTQLTNSPGKQYPNQNVTHRFSKSGELNLRVDTIYRVRYKIGNGGWQTLNSTISAPGPVTRITVREATALLTK